MRLRSRYLLLGVSWSLLLAPATAYAVLGVIAGALWIYVYGDNPWPAFADSIIPVVGLAAFTTTAAVFICFAYSYGRQREVAGKGDDPGERRTVLLLTLAPLALLAIASIDFWQRGMRQAEATAELDWRETAFNELLNASHRVARLTAHQTVGNDFEVAVTSSGGQAGPYRLFWKVQDMVNREVLAEDADDLELGAEAVEFSLEISIGELANGYLNAILSGGGVFVDEHFELVVTLEPVIEEQDLEAWPSYARDQWERGESPLRSTAAMQLPVQFGVGIDRTIDFSTP